MIQWHATFSSRPLRACWRNIAGLPLGIIANGRVLVHLSFDAHRHQQARTRLSRAGLAATDGLPAPQLLEILHALAAGDLAPTPVPCSSWFCRQATPFQQRVWRELAAIPRGTTQTYGELARHLGNPGLARAVGNACHHNPLALVLPCHRVVAAASLGGFAGPARIKQLLLLREKVKASR